MADVKWTVRLLLGVSSLVSAKSGDLEIIHNVSWGDALRQCGSRGGRLYTHTDPDPQQTVTFGSYWVGAKVQYSSWMWTENNVPLYRYVGQANVSSIAFSHGMHEIPYDNQASTCYYKCRPTNKPYYIGMQGSKCYCINRSNLRLVDADNETDQDGCWGNFNECCGSSETISVYRTDVTRKIHWSFDPEGTCGFLFQNSTYMTLKAETNCSVQKGYICKCPVGVSGDICVYHTKNESWSSADSLCKLKNLSGNKMSSAKIQANVPYWIGLKRSKNILWIDSDYVLLNISNSQTGCLVVQKEQNNISFYISNCTDMKSALCILNETSTPRVQRCGTRRTSTTSTVFSSTSRVSEGGTTGFISSTTNDLQSTSSSISTASSLSEDPSDQSGVAVGVSVAVVVLVVAGTLLAVIWMKRSKRFCFQTKSDSAASRGQSAGERESDYDQIKETSNYEFESVPKRNVPNTSRYLTLDTSTNGTATTAHVTTDEDDYNVLSHNSPPHSPVKSNANAYSHINIKKKGQKRCDVIDDDYDTAGSNVTSSRDPTYNHVIDDVTDGDYDTAGSNVTSARDPTYNHITGSQIDDDTDGDYDTTGSNVMSTRDPTYSHIKGEVEGDYSTAGADSRVEPAASDDYSHIGVGYV